MRYFPLYILLILFIQDSAKAQFIVIYPRFSDCTSCLTQLPELNPHKLKIPVFAIAENNKRDDKDAMEERFQLPDFHIPLLFNDYWAKRRPRAVSTTWLSVRRSDGSEAFSAALRQLDMDSLRAVLARLEATNSDACTSTNFSNRKLVYTFGSERMIIRDDTAKSVVTLKSREVKNEWIAQILSGNEQARFLKYGPTIRSKFKALHWGFKMYRTDFPEVIRFLFEYQNTPDSISENVRSHHAIVEFDLAGRYLRTLGILYPDSLTLMDVSFLSNSDNLFAYVMPLSGRPFSHGAIGKFKRSDSLHYVFEGFTGEVISPIRQKQLGYSFLTTHPSVYPYLGNQYSNTIFNLESGATYSILPQENYDSVLKIMFSTLNLLSGPAPETIPFTFFGTALSPKQRGFKAYYKYDGALWAKTFSASGAVKDQRLPWTTSEVAWLNPSPDGEDITIYISTDDETRCFTIPTSLFD